VKSAVTTHLVFNYADMLAVNSLN